MEYNEFKPQFEIEADEVFSSDPSLQEGYIGDDGQMDTELNDEGVPFDREQLLDQDDESTVEATGTDVSSSIGTSNYPRQQRQYQPQYQQQRYNNQQRNYYQQQQQYNQNNSKEIYVPELVKQFVSYLHKHIKERKTYDIQSMYENSFNKITEKYYKQSAWPPAESISQFVNNDSLFLMLYKELTYRHVYSKMIPTLEQRFDSWRNYCEFFNFLINGSADLELELPNQWLWDMIDEFIYQYQSYCQFRSKLKNRPAEDLNILKNNPQIWNTVTVINYLQSLVAKSRIISVLEKEKQGNSANNTQDNGEGKSFGSHPVYKMLGYFSLVGLLRVQCLLGDYYLALKTVSCIEVNSRGLLTKVTACHVTFFYYLGFIYMMMRRYVDAIKTFSNILLYTNRIKQYHNRSSQYEQMLKKNEQMYALLAICQSLCPQRVDENVHTYLKEHYSDKTQRMQKGDETVFEELFNYACPKFVSPAPPNYALVLEDPIKNPANNYHQEASRLQTKLFLAEVKQQTLLPTIRSYLKLYTTIGTNKLADFLETDQNTLRTQLLCYKHKMRALQWNKGSPLTGELTTSSDVDFYIDKDMVHIYDTKVQRKYSEFFIRHINKFESIITDLAENKSQ